MKQLDSKVYVRQNSHESLSPKLCICCRRYLETITMHRLLALRPTCRQLLYDSSLPFCIRARSSSTFSHDFTFVPNFFNAKEQRVLLAAALQKLDAMDNRTVQRRRKNFIASQHGSWNHEFESLSDIFLPDQCYQFEEVLQHYALYSPS